MGTSLLFYNYDRFEDGNRARLRANTAIIENPDHGLVAKLVLVRVPIGKDAVLLSAVPHP
jgi:hypothetical protein